MDVSKPGKTAPSASSRPVIVGHKPILKDPMVQRDKSKDRDEEKPSGESEEHKITVNRTGPKVVAPLNIPDETESKEEEEDADESALPPKVSSALTGESESAEDEAETTPKPEAEAEELPEELPAEPAEPEAPGEEPAVTEDSPASPPSSQSKPAKESDKDSGKEKSRESKSAKDKNTAVIDAVAGEVAKNKDKKDAALDTEIQKHQAEIDKLVEQKKYFVHTSQTTKSQRKTRWIAVLLVLLLLSGAYLAVDAQVIKNDIQLPYEFFKEEKQPDPSVTVPTTTNPATKPEKQTEKEKEAYSGQVVELASKAFSIKIPDGWQVQVFKDSIYPQDVNTADSLVYTPGKKPVVSYPEGFGTDAPIRFQAFYIKNDEETILPQDDETKAAFITDTGAKGTRYYRQEPLKDVEGIGAYPGAKSYRYEFEVKDGGKVYVIYRILQKNQYHPANQLPKSDPDQLELVEQVVKTLKIN